MASYVASRSGKPESQAKLPCHVWGGKIGSNYGLNGIRSLVTYGWLVRDDQGCLSGSTRHSAQGAPDWRAAPPAAQPRGGIAKGVTARVHLSPYKGRGARHVTARSPTGLTGGCLASPGLGHGGSPKPPNFPSLGW
ncbi:hypothetical protein I7I51_05870 [Histoplasma capsulatum]|uniref:Uncharacterized protein n=1 Tax=Ajellomyces capsulatus TaxID=5037 RepID=A0A8A1M994_AJECA|nr:hypothetical protein I7I51_05870 [Histoplasma capsulatum]